MRKTLWQNIKIKEAKEHIEALENTIAETIYDLTKVIKEKLRTEMAGPAIYYVNEPKEGKTIEEDCIKAFDKFKKQLESIRDLDCGYFVNVFESIEINEDDEEDMWNVEGQDLDDVLKVINNNLQGSPENFQEYTIEYRINIQQNTRNGSLSKDIMKIKIKQSYYDWTTFNGFSVKWIPLQEEILDVNTDCNFVKFTKVGEFYVDDKNSFYTEEEIFKLM